MVTAFDISFQYPGGREISFPNISLENGRSILIRGKSGSGKTTLLNLLAALLPIQKGNIKIDNTSLRSLSGKAMDRFRGRHIGLVLQQHHFVESISTDDNVRLAPWLAGKAMDKMWYAELKERLGIGSLLHKKPGQLSIGEQQRVSIARALINRPAVLLADEPTSSLDDDNAHIVSQLLKELTANTGTSLIMVTHDNRLSPDFPNQISLT